MQLRRRLLIYTLVTLLPLILFSIGAMVLIARHEQSLYERSARERTLALLTAVDAELEGHFVTLRALATSRALEQGDLAAFREEALRTLAAEPRWSAIRVDRPSGRRVLDTAIAPDTPLPAAPDDPTSLEDVVTRRRPTVGGVFLDARHQRPVFHARIPIMMRGELTGVLSALVDPESIGSMLRMQRLPSGWVGVVLDRERRIVARTVRHAATVGSPASESLRSALELGGPSGWFRGATLEGTPVYSPFNRSSFSQWTVALGIPVEVVEAGALRTAWMLALGVLFATGAAIALAAALGRQITRPISDLRNAANMLARGDPVDDGVSAGVAEVDEVRHALAHASRIVREREAALRAADRAKDEFLAMLGHELRNPLSAIASAAQILKLPEAGEAAIGKASSIVGRQVDHMTRLVDDLLDVGRVTSGRVQLARQRFDLSTRVAATLDGLRSTGRLAAHTLRTRLEPVWIEADEARIEQIVVNLVGNATKYTPPGGRVEVRVGREGSEAVIEVIDDGQGLSPELLPRVFDLFVQGERSLDRSEGGLGIGLTLVKRLVELHGGTTQATSEGEGRGARFVVRLPAVLAPPLPDKQLIPTELDVPPLRILVIEDNEDARDALVGALALRGHATSGAADGPSGLARAAELAPDVIVVDIGLPGLDGCEVARRLRALPLGGSGILIALSGYGQAEMRERALASGFDAYLVKPITARELLQRLATLRATRERVDDRS